MLFLREPVKLDGLYPWETIVLQTDSEIVITAPDTNKAKDIKAVSMIILKTAFGATKHVVQQVSPVHDICFFTSMNDLLWNQQVLNHFKFEYAYTLWIINMNKFHFPCANYENVLMFINTYPANYMCRTLAKIPRKLL